MLDWVEENRGGGKVFEVLVVLLLRGYVWVGSLCVRRAPVCVYCAYGVGREGA